MLARPETDEISAAEAKKAKARFLAMRDEWIDYVNQNDRLSHATTRVATFLALRINAKTQTCHWPVKKIAKMIPSAPGRQMSTSTIAKALSELQDENLLLVTRASRRQNQVYAIHLPHFEVRRSKHSETRKSNHY